MQNSSVAAGLPCGISAKKRRYSSTAVGFPIRNDQKRYSQDISEGFPTCIGARRVRIYVRGRHFCEYQSYEALHSASTRSTYLPLFASSTPCRVQNLPLSRPTQHHVSVLNRPCDLLVTSNPLSDHERTWSLRKRTQPARLPSRLANKDRIIDQAQSTQLALLANRLPDHHHITPSRPTPLRLMLCPGSPTVDRTNATRCRQESIGVVSGFTWESLGDVPHSICPSYVLDMSQVRVRSTMVPGSFMLQLNSLINETTYCINSMRRESSRMHGLAFTWSRSLLLRHQTLQAWWAS